MIKTSTIFFQQDTLIRPATRQNRSLLNLPVEKPQINLERALEVIEQSAQREQEIVDSQRRVYTPRVEPIRQPSIEIDSLMAKYRYIGCTPRSYFPDTFSLTILERYYQPMARAIAPESAVADSTLSTLPIVADTTSVAIFQAAVDTTGVMPLPDSLFATSATTKTGTTIVETPSVVTGFASEARPAGYPSIITLFLVCGLVLLASIKFNFGKNLAQALVSFFSYRQAQRMFEERKESDRQAALLSNILYIFITGIFITILLPVFGATPLWGSYTLSVIFFSLAVGSIYFIKASVWRMLGVVFMTQSFSRTYIYNMFLYNRNTGLFIFPLVAVLPYIADAIAPYVVYSVIAVFVFSYLLKIWRIFQIIHAQNVSVYYFILYLCTLEILPLLLLIKSCKVLNDCLVI